MGMDLFSESQDWQDVLPSHEPRRAPTSSQYHAEIPGTE